MAGGQEGARVIGAVPHMLGRGDHPRQTLDTLTFLRLEFLAPAVEGRRRDDPLHQRHRVGRTAVDMARHRAERGLGQPGLHLLLELFDRSNLSA